MYRLQVSHPAHKQIADLPPEVASRVNEAIASLADQPRPHGVIKLAGSGDFRIRVGDYRVVYGVDDGTQTVVVYRVKHRREAYR